MPSPPKGRPTPIRAFKALQACRRYYSIDRKIKEVTRELGDTICTRPNYAPDFGEVDTLLQPTEHNACIDFHYYYGHLNKHHITYEKMCDGCKYKHNLIQYRKELRQKLGAAKRWINALGKEEDNNVR